jgi:hypothetical protein
MPKIPKRLNQLPYRGSTVAHPACECQDGYSRGMTGSNTITLVDNSGADSIGGDITRIEMLERSFTRTQPVYPIARKS